MTFKDLNLDEKILKAIELEGYEMPSLIQEKAIPIIMKGRDVLAGAQTGTGKTAAFALPLIQKFINHRDRNIKVLVLVPTRELALQVRDNFRSYAINTSLKSSVIFGGVNQSSQVAVLRKGVDFLVATPGRLLDLIKQGYVQLDNVETFVLDEADTMLDMGFIHDVRRIVEFMPKKRQTIMLSATITTAVKRIAGEFLVDYETIKVNSEMTVDSINQSVYFVDKVNKSKLLLEILSCDEIKSALIFVRTKHGANKLGEILQRHGIESGIIHGNKSQSARVAALQQFKSGFNKVLVATDIAARGIDIDKLSHVINYEMPENVETYVHRIGRTGRAGLEGIAISLCAFDEKETFLGIEKTISQTILAVEGHGYPMENFIIMPKGINRGQKSNQFRDASNRDNRFRGGRKGVRKFN